MRQAALSTLLITTAAAADRVAVLVAGHCDKTHACGPDAWASLESFVLKPLAAKASVDVWLCARDADQMAAEDASKAAGARFQMHDVFDAAEDLSNWQRQFGHRRACYQAAGTGYDWRRAA